MSNQNISQNPSARELLKAAIFCFAHTVARQQMAGMDLDEKKGSSEKFLELENDVHIMDNEMCYLIDMLNSGTPLSDEEFSKVLAIAPNCLKFTPWNAKK